MSLGPETCSSSHFWFLGWTKGYSCILIFFESLLALELLMLRLEVTTSLCKDEETYKNGSLLMKSEGFMKMLGEFLVALSGAPAFILFTL